MSNKLSEQVSALMDDECSEQELKLAVRQLTRDPTLAARWERYHLISDVLKGDTPTTLTVDFARRMHDLIDAEPPLALTASSPQPRWWNKPITGLALAASVSAIALLWLRPGMDEPLNDTLLAQPVMTEVTEQQWVVTETSSVTHDMAARMNVYMVNHNSLASMSNVYGVLPYVRMSSFSDGR